MKKLALTLAIILGITLGASAQNGGLFGKGPSSDKDYEYSTREGEGGLLNLPGQHGSSNDETAPLGSGALLIIGFGAAYAMKKRNEK
jgi:hypothetical protein